VKILLVEDNSGDIRLTMEAFKGSKISVDIDVVTDGEMAIEYLENKANFDQFLLPDLVLLDLNIPKKDGREVLEFIKNHPVLKKLPVVILTTSNAEIDIVKSYNLHVNAYINKPVDFHEFYDIVQKIDQFWLQTAILPNNTKK
jgi:two-component system, chemotaxis family, response regulator Rcp1